MTTNAFHNPGFSPTGVKAGLIPLVLLSVSVAALWPAPAHATSDLLVAPTRLVLDDRLRSSEVILNNIGQKVATYRISLELKRMTADGRLADVEAPSAKENLALDLVSYAPRRVTLAPNQPQAIRVAVRKPDGLADGEYRVHMLFRAVPDDDSAPATAAPRAQGLSIQLTPIYGVTIPVIVRSGELQATAAISGVHLAAAEDGKPAIAVDLARAGDRSVFGEVRVMQAGRATPIAVTRGVAIYPEIASRELTLPLAADVKGAVAGPVTVQYLEPTDRGPKLIAETQATLR